MAMDAKALWTMSYGMYLVTARAGGRANGQIANAVFQVTAEPPRMAVAINKDNFTHDLIRDGGWFAFSVLAETVPMEFIPSKDIPCEVKPNEITLISTRTPRSVNPLTCLSW